MDYKFELMLDVDKTAADLMTIVAALDIAMAFGEQYAAGFAARGFPVAAERYLSELAKMASLRDRTEKGLARLVAKTEE